MANPDQIIEVSVPDLQEVEKQLRGMRKKAPAALSKAINRTIRDVAGIMAKEAQAEYLVKAAAAKKTLRIKKANKSTLSGEVVSSSSERIKLYKFRTNPKEASPGDPQSAMAQVRKRTGIKNLPGDGEHSGAFIAQMKSGHTGVFQRQIGITETKQETERTRRRAASKFRGWADNPIAELTGPAIPSMFKSKQLSSEVIDKGNTAMQKALDTELQRLLRG